MAANETQLLAAKQALCQMAKLSRHELVAQTVLLCKLLEAAAMSASGG